jgi:hypothetical protein
MCKKSDADPMLRLFFDRYKLNLLAVPREGAAIGDVYIRREGKTSTPGSVRWLLDPPLEKMPPAKTGEQMADVAGTLSQRLDAELGLGLLEGFLAALGALGLSAKARAGVKASKVHTLRFRFADATRDAVDPFQLGFELNERRIATNNAIIEPGQQYYLVTGLARSPSISMVTENEHGNSVELDLAATGLAEVEAGVSVAHTNTGEVTFKGAQSLVFGLELYELSYDAEEERLRLRLPDNAVRLRRKRATRDIIQPVLLGSDDEVLLGIAEAKQHTSSTPASGDRESWRAYAPGARP